MSDREAMKLALEALEWAWGGEPMGTKEQAAMQALRTALAAPRPEPEPVAYFDLQKQVFFWAKPTMIDVPMTVALNPLPLYAAPPAAAPESTHPGYIIGLHWLETAYSRVCAGEAEADVLRDCGWERVTDAEALRRDAERLNWVRVELFRPIWDGATDKPCEWHLRDDYKHTIQRMQGNNFRAAIDAAMGGKT